MLGCFGCALQVIWLISLIIPKTEIPSVWNSGVWNTVNEIYKNNKVTAI